MSDETAAPSKERKGSVVWSLFLILMGALAITLPHVASVAIAVLISWVLLVSGILHLANAIHHRHLPSVWLKAIVGVIYTGLGAYLLFSPSTAVSTLTLLLGMFFLIEGIFELSAWLVIRHLKGTFWLLLDGLVALVLGFMIWSSFPSDAPWAIGTLVGINFLVSGFSRLMISVNGHHHLADEV